MTQKPSSPSVWEVIKSVLAAFFGVQSDNVRQRDFAQGRPWIFIIVGILLATFLVLLIYAAVRIILSESGINP